jgi:hypothetical protein
VGILLLPSFLTINDRTTMATSHTQNHEAKPYSEARGNVSRDRKARVYVIAKSYRTS